MLAAGSIVPRRADTGASVRVTYAAVVTDGTVGGTVWTVLLGRAVSYHDLEVGSLGMDVVDLPVLRAPGVVDGLVVRLRGGERQGQSPVGRVRRPARGELLQEHTRGHPGGLAQGDPKRLALARAEGGGGGLVRGVVLAAVALPELDHS